MKEGLFPSASLEASQSIYGNFLEFGGALYLITHEYLN